MNPLLATASESELQGTVEGWLEFWGWRYYHERPVHVCPRCHAPLPHQSNPGLHDIIATDGRTLLLAELKTMKGRIRPEQQAWDDALSGVRRLSSGIYRPDEFDHLQDIISRKE